MYQSQSISYAFTIDIFEMHVVPGTTHCISNRAMQMFNEEDVQTSTHICEHNWQSE